MAVTNTTTVASRINTEMIFDLVQKAIGAFATMRDLMWIENIGAGSTTKGQFTKVAALGAPDSSTEGSAATPKAFTLTDVVSEALVYELAVQVSKRALRSAKPGLEALIADEMGREFADKFDSVAAALLAGFSNTVGTTTHNLTHADMITAMVTRNQNAKSRAANLVCVLSPRQYGDLQEESLGASTGLGAALSKDQFSNIFGFSGGAAYNAMRGSIDGIPLIVSNNVPTANSGDDDAGALFVAGMGGALGGVIQWEPELTVADQAVSYISGKAYFGDASFSAIEVNDLMGVSIITDH